VTAVAEPEVGKARVRKEDARLITGRSRYTDAITPPGTLYLNVVRSPIAHATIAGIDASAARQAPGVIGVYTAADLGVEAVGLPCAWPITPDMKSPQRPLLASSTVHFAGEGVAVVIARSAAEGRDATDLVEVDYDPLPPVLDMEAALAEGATLVHPDLGTNENATWVFDSGAAGTGASVDEAIAAAEADPDSVVIRRRFRQQRLIPAFMEPRSCVVDPTGEQITIYAATQIPHIVRTMAAVTMRNEPMTVSRFPYARFVQRPTSSIATPPMNPNPAIAGNHVAHPNLSSSFPITNNATPAPKYWNESITPAAKPAIFRPPMSIGAAAPTIEWVEFAVSEINTRNKQLRKTPFVPIPSINRTAVKITTVSRKYRVIATGARCPRKILSEMMPEPNEPTTATIGMS
jgi:hypothetical protein